MREISAYNIPFGILLSLRFSFHKWASKRTDKDFIRLGLKETRTYTVYTYLYVEVYITIASVRKVTDNKPTLTKL